MTNLRWLGPCFVAAVTFAACSSKDALLEVRDGAVDTSNHADTGSGGAGPDATANTGGAMGTGGMGSGHGGVSGPGGAGGSPGTGGSGTGGGGATTKTDGGMAGSVGDAGYLADGGDAIVECAPGYPVGSSMQTGDCNTCVCVAGGAWACSTHVCPPDAGPEAPIPGWGIDAGGPACSQVSTQADCQARSDCHAVFADTLPCTCTTPGCCMSFSMCVDGPADCVRPTQFSCTIAEMTCTDPYQLSYRADCPEGCVIASDCP